MTTLVLDIPAHLRGFILVEMKECLLTYFLAAPDLKSRRLIEPMGKIINTLARLLCVPRVSFGLLATAYPTLIDLGTHEQVKEMFAHELRNLQPIKEGEIFGLEDDEDDEDYEELHDITNTLHKYVYGILGASAGDSGDRV